MSGCAAALFRASAGGGGADTGAMRSTAARARGGPVAAAPSSPWRWPLPALAIWLLAWGLFAAAAAAGWPRTGLALALLAGGLAALGGRGTARRLWLAAGFPASALALGAAAGAPAALWLLPLLPLLLAYPLRAWRDAPFFPTPAAALDGLAAAVGAPARVLEAGCGLGHGLAALRRQFPRAELVGLEWSPLLAALARRRRPDAQVRRGDLWAEPWSGYDLVYLFQRPESMARAWAKAGAEMAPGAWLASLEFAVPGVEPHARLAGADGRALWLYRVPAAARSMHRPACR
jgi:SAM-dependent methyltransferase